LNMQKHEIIARLEAVIRELSLLENVTFNMSPGKADDTIELAIITVRLAQKQASKL
jgi:hypothetical protein